MKRAMKRLFPIFLGLVVICSIIWYLFMYDRGFMQDILLGGARLSERNGNHNMATWFYNLAYQQSGNDDDVVIELAERFKKMGNYTQAEVVLTSAISEGATVDLYVALSKTYVEQDKLLDAANMLESVTNPDIKAQLDSMRPTMPVASPAPGYYSQYINVSIQAGAGDSLYVSASDDFPSIEDTFHGEVSLVGGENNFYAVAVGKNGLVSTPAFFGYTVGGVIEEVDISDPVLDGLYRELLGVGAEKQLFTNELWTITSLTVPQGVADYSELRHLVYLETLVIENLDIDGLQMLSSLTQLKSLTIRGCPLSATDLSVIGALPNLENLTLTDCSLSNISGLSSASKLITLDLSNNAIRDLAPLSFMENLSTLNLSRNALTNLSALSALEALTALDVSYNSLTSIVPLSACPKLTVLVANNNHLTEMPTFDNTTVLSTLYLNNNNLMDISSLADYTSLTQLNLAENQISDVSSLSGLNLLAAVDISKNQITTLPSWSKSCALLDLKATDNQITSVAPLRGLARLNYIDLDNNLITNINPLAECRMLVRVSVFGNAVKDVSKLTDMSIIVNYNPL